MRTVIGFTLVAMSALSLHAVGCATSATNAAIAAGVGGSTGEGPTTGAGGDGGGACVPEPEVCDHFDNDCDMEVDEGCECLEGDTQDCYTGPAGTENVGSCAMGTQHCDLATNTFGPCEGEVTPAASDACDGADDDCNGQIDDGIADLVCGVGACTVVVAGCTDGEPGDCVPGLPSLEICDGLDNDCDQLVDESFPGSGAACDTGIPGQCAAGTTQCDGVAAACVPTLSPAAELCDDIDNDCNGAVDDGIPGTGGDCSTGYPGVCGPGTITCQAGIIDCFSTVAPSPEICDGLDNNCDGAVDEANPEGGGACDTGQPGVCQAGTLNCIGGAIQCVANVSAASETCDGLDNNCNGAVDEGAPGSGVACGCGGTTACVNGQIACQGGPIIYFSDTFANNNAGWTFDPTWAIGPTFAGAGSFPDPAMDHTATADNGVAGVVIGGNAPTSVHPLYYMTSPAFNTNVGTPVILEFWRWLNSDYTPYMQNVIEVYNGASWVQIFTTGSFPGASATSWTKFTYDLSAYKNANMRIRFGYLVTSFALSVSSWNIDDVVVANTGCP